MSKKRNIEEVARVLTLSLAHKIGSIVNKEDLYASKYREEGEHYFKKTLKVAESINWNRVDKVMFKETLQKNLSAELQKRDFLANEKFLFIEQEIASALIALNLS